MLGLRIPFGTDGTQYRKGLATMRQETKQWSKSLKGMFIGVFGASAVIAGFNRWFDRMDKIHKLSQRLGHSMRDLQKIEVISEKNGTTLQVVSNLLTRLQRRAGQAAQGSKEMGQAWKDLGVDVESFAKLSPEDQLVVLADAFNSAEKKGIGVSAMMKLLDTEARELIPLLSSGGDSIREQWDGVSTVGDSTISTVVKLKDEWTDFKNKLSVVAAFVLQVFKSIGVVVGASVASWIGLFQTAFHRLSQGVSSFGELVKAAFTGDIEGIKDAWRKGNLAMKGAVDDVLNHQKSSLATLKEEMSDIWDDSGSARGRTVGAPKIVDQEEANRLVKIMQLKDEIADKERKAHMESLSLEERRNKLVEERLALLGQANDDTIEGLQMKKKVLALENDISKIDKEQGKINLKEKNEIDKIKADILSAQEDDSFSKLSDNEKIKFLGEKQSGLTDKADSLRGEGDVIGALKAQRDAEQVGREKKELERDRDSRISDLQDELKDSKESRLFDQLADEEKKSFLLTKRNDLLTRAKKLESDGDNEESLELKIKADSLQSELDQLGQSDSDRGGVPTIAVSSLASIGGGGGVASSLVDPMLREAQQQTSAIREGNSLLRQLLTVRPSSDRPRPVS